MPKSINETFIYKNMDKGQAITSNIVKILTEGKILTQKDLEEPMIIINRYKFPLKTKVLQDFNNGIIRLVVPPTGVKLPTYMPFFLTKDGGEIVAIIDASVYGTVLKDGSFSIDAKKLYCLMEGAYLATLYYKYEHTIKQKGNILIKGSSIYSNIFIRVLNKEYALNINKDRMHKIIFLASKFFLINVVGMANNDMAFNYAIKNLNGNASMMMIEELDEEFEPKYYADFSTFIQGIATLSDRLNLGMETLTVRGYIENFITMYDSSALLMLEYFPYFLYNLICVIDGGYINNQKLMEQIIGGDAASLYADIVQLAH